MQATKILQAVILMLILAMAASCAAGRQYSSKVFGPRPATTKENTAKQVRFLGGDEDSTGTVATTLTNPVTTKDSSLNVIPGNSPEKNRSDSVAPVVKNRNTGAVRNKRTRDDQ